MIIRNTLSGKVFIAQKLKSFIRDFVCKYNQMRRNLLTFTEEGIKEKPHFYCGVCCYVTLFCVGFLLVTIKLYSSNVLILININLIHQFKNYEKCFLFHLKGYFCSQDI